MKMSFFVMFLLLFLVLLECSDSSERENPTISVASDSAYADAFEDLSLGFLFDFDFTLPRADERSVDMWMETYRDGE